jgi:tripartite-type tricarboxylate transporter receptor subunit TctC
MKVLYIATCLAILTNDAAAQDFPTKPIRVVVPYPAGGIVDVVARTVTENLSAIWGQPIIVEARPGANANLGTAEAVRAPPDGYTWLINGPALTANPTIYGNLPWDPRRDFSGLGVVTWSLNVAVVPAHSPAQSVQDFVAMAKNQPGTLFYGNPGVGSSNHLGTELLKQVAGIDLAPVGYKGQPPALPDLISGRLHFKLVSVGLATPHINSGKLRPLALIAKERSTLLPDVPTIVEAGYPDAAVIPWYGFVTRAGTPKSIITRINADINKVLLMPDVRVKLEKLGGQVASPMTPREIDALIRSDFEKWAKVIRSASIKPE